MSLSLSGDGAITGMVSASSSDLSTALAAKLDASAYTPGLSLIAPTGIAYSSGSASTSGGTTSFSGVTSVSVNGVFDSSYENYMVVLNKFVSSVSDMTVSGRMRSSGSDATASNYTTQELTANTTAVVGGRYSNEASWRFPTMRSNAQGCDTAVILCRPNVAAPTTFSTSWAYDSYSGALVAVSSGYHNVSTAYDGLTVYAASGTFGGTIRVYGYEGA